MENELVEFGKRLEDFLHKEGLTRRQVAEAIGCTGATLGRWMRGEGPYAFLWLAKLRQKYGVDLNKFVCGKSKGRPSELTITKTRKQKTFRR